MPNEPVSSVRLYRVVSQAEYDDIKALGRFRQGPNSFEGKWFADTLEGAESRIEQLFPKEKCYIVAADLAIEMLDHCYQMDNLDHRGTATYVYPEFVDRLIPVLDWSDQ